MAGIDATVLAVFRQEAMERLRRLETLVVSLEKDPEDGEVFSGLAREVHTLKGSAKMLGMDPVAELAHKFEDVMAALTAKRLKPAAEVFSTMLEVADGMSDLVEAFANDASPTTDPAELIERLERLATGQLSGDDSGDDSEAAGQASEPEPVSRQPHSGAATEPPQERDDPSAATEPPAPPKPKPAPARDPAAAPKAPEKKPALAVMEVTRAAALGPLAASAKQAAPEVTAAGRTFHGQPIVPIGERAAAEQRSGKQETLRRAQTIRADVSRLDTIMNLVGEAAINHTRAEGYLLRMGGFLRQCEAAHKLAVRGKERLVVAHGAGEHIALDELARTHGEIVTQLEALRASMREFRIGFDADTLENTLILQALRQEVAEVRMLPIATIFSRYPRAVRDLANERHKQVELVLEGEQTRLDQKVLENIEAPLVHILRNAVDHGIEAPKERRRLGKPETGTIKLSCFQESGRIAIVVEDDGRGLDPERLRQIAVDGGFLTASEAEGLGDREALYLICADGFSSSARVSQVSGRGVGMNVVKDAIEDSKGELEIDSTVGKGTTFRISLPLSVAVTQVLMVEIARQRYCIPTLSIERVQVVRREETQYVADRPVVRVGRRNVPLVELSAVLGMHKQDGEDTRSEVPVVFLAHARQRVAFVVDRLVSEQEIVIKSFGKVLRSVPNVAGATILGTGEVVVILHPPDLMRHGLALAGTTVPSAAWVQRAEAAVEEATVMVVDDMLSTREMEREILEVAGYKVDTAVHGRDALAQTEGKQHSLFVIDIQMPEMDGFELLAELRRSRQHAKTPVIIVSGLSSEADRKKGKELGADAHLSKSDFSSKLLLETVSRFVSRPGAGRRGSGSGGA